MEIQRLKKPAEFNLKLGDLKAGETLELKYRKDGQLINHLDTTLMVTDALASSPDETSVIHLVSGETTSIKKDIPVKRINGAFVEIGDAPEIVLDKAPAKGALIKFGYRFDEKRQECINKMAREGMAVLESIKIERLIKLANSDLNSKELGKAVRRLVKNTGPMMCGCVILPVKDPNAFKKSGDQ